MARDLGALADQTCDMLVVGGGIHGLFAAWEAARRGLSVALVERGDYGSGLSSNHQRTVHGGLRALESGQLNKVRQQIAERRRWAVMAPALLRPLPFLAPTRRGERPSRLVLGAGLRVYDALGAGRNRGLPEALHLPPCRVLAPDYVQRLLPEVSISGLTGAAEWHDYQTVYPDRLNWLVALAAKQAGARLFSYAEALGALRQGVRFAGVAARDRLSGDTFEVRARATLITAGSALPTLFATFGLNDQPPPLVAAANVLVDRPARSHAVAARGPSGRRLTAVPWAAHTLIGTFQSAGAVASSDAFPISIQDMLAETNAAFPWLGISDTDVRLVHRGLVPAHVHENAAELLADSRLIHHRSRGATNVLSLVGVKFTTARLAARRAVDALIDEASLRVRSPTTDIVPLPHATTDRLTPEADARARKLALDVEVKHHLGAWYGTEADHVLAFAERTGLTERVSPSCPVIAAEVGYALEQSDAVTLDDVMTRRTRLALTGAPGEATVRAVERIAGHLGVVPAAPIK